MSGLVHIYTGNGKGKTTASIGLGLRAAGRGMRVLLVQFLKGAHSGELDSLALLGAKFEVKRGNYVKKFVNAMNSEELAETKQECKDLFGYAIRAAADGGKELIILDEIMAAIKCGFVAEDEVLHLVKTKPENLELVLTGRDAPADLVEAADYVMEIKPVKHPFDKGVKARPGIEF